MKKNYTSPVVEVNAFDFEDVVMTSGTGSTYSVGASAGESYAGNVEKLRKAAGVKAIIVEW